jgi:hypothetical protein
MQQYELNDKMKQSINLKNNVIMIKRNKNVNFNTKCTFQTSRNCSGLFFKACAPIAPNNNKIDHKV